MIWRVYYIVKNVIHAEGDCCFLSKYLNNERGIGMLLNRVDINLNYLEEPLLLISDEDVFLFQQLIQPVIEFKLVECQLALSTRKSVSTIRDIWLALYKDNQKIYVNTEQAMLYPIRLILFELVSKEEYFKRLAEKSRGDECLSLLYAIIYLQFVMQWLNERFRGQQQICDSMKVVFVPTDEQQPEDNHLTISKEKKLAQALIVKSIRFEVQKNQQEFSSLLFQTYNLIEYLHGKASGESELNTRTLPSMCDVAELLNTYYSKRYMANEMI